jgi:RHS repeat-associated protein
MGEKFAANPVTGTGSFTVPIATSPGRSGFAPQLSLSYDSAAGNGPFGFGWTLSLPSISRKTDKGLPRYVDAEDSDVFILSGAEDLVPVFEQDGAGNWVRDPDGNFVIQEHEVAGYIIRRYRPRIEGLFARIERWTRRGDGDVHWRSISRDNILTIYGADANSRIADPADPGRIFCWLICQTRDDKGNAIVYEYKAEDGAGIDLTRAHERNRTTAQRTANRYLKTIRYGNRVPLLDSTGHRPRLLTKTEVESAGWMFEVVLDHGEGHLVDVTIETDRQSFVTATVAGTKPWACRQDPFSSCRAGFEVRTYRRCERVLMFHHFPDDDIGNDCLVRSTDFDYSPHDAPATAQKPVYSFLQTVTQNGYKRRNGRYLKRGLPPVAFAYSEPVVGSDVHDVDAESLEGLPIGVDGAAYAWTDLHGEGILGILAEFSGGWFYKRNISPVSERPVEFAPAECVATKPAPGLAAGQAQFMDLAGDGLPDLVVLDGPMPGLYEHDEGEGWQAFRPFTSRLNRVTRDPNLRFVDLDGDGHPDVLITEGDALVWHASLAEQGFGPARRVSQALDEEKGPRLVFGDASQSIYLADMSGDGLTDLVRIRNGEVCYWPNLGYGRFGAKVTMDDAPRFDHPDQFDQQRIRVADIDGTGTTDIVYLHADGVRLYFNQSGNGWSAAQLLPVFPPVSELAAIAPADLLGNGTACLVWSSPLPGDARRQMRYVDLMGGRREGLSGPKRDDLSAGKPHLLVKITNNLGAETNIHYAPSTKFYLKDKRDGRPWITRLPFPVYVVEYVETLDRIGGNRFTTRYAYHHGYFDGEEREFRGFGMVEQWDTEEFTALRDKDAEPEATNLDAASHVPPVLTKTWFHTGIYLGRDHVSDFFAGLLDTRDLDEYYRDPVLSDEDARRRLLPDTVMPDGLSLEEERQACRALKGAMLRQEVYGLDDTSKAEIPYTVAEQNFTIRRLQPRGSNEHAVFVTHAREAINYHYERNPADPRISHALTLDVDSYGNVLRQVAVGYGRKQSPHSEQTTALITYTESAFANAIDDRVRYPDDYRTPLSAETRTYEVTGVAPKNAPRFSLEEWVSNNFALTSLSEIFYEQAAADGVEQRRLIEHVRTLYRKDDLTALLPLRKLEPLALPGESYKLALTPRLLSHVFKRKVAGQPEEDLLHDVDPAVLLEGKDRDEGGYVEQDGKWWIPSGRAFFDPRVDVTAAIELSTAQSHFYLPRRFVDPFGYCSFVGFDPRDLLVSQTKDALANVVMAENDYRVLQPRLITDPNGNRTAAAFDAVGIVVATAVMGKQGENLGDLLEDFDPDPPLQDLQAFIADPHGRTASLLGKATTRMVYDLDRFQRAGQPPFAATLARETHLHDPGGAQTNIQIGFSYSDGFGREIQKKVQAERGRAPERQDPASLGKGDIGPGDLVRDGPSKLAAPAEVQRRWVGSGRVVFNNKGKPVRQYEPFFSATHLYEPEREMTDTGVSTVLFYDPLERVVATVHPNDTYEKVVFDPWRQGTYDVNDTVAADPRTDPDIDGYVHRYFEQRPDWKTWHAQRIGNQLGPAERKAADKAAAHANTPTVAHFDALGRPFLTISHNRYERGGQIRDEEYATRVELDIEGNQRAVVDAKDRVVMRYDYDMLGNRIHQASMEAGERWMLSDVVGNPIRAWDSRGFVRKMTYDELRRPTELYVTENRPPRLAEKTVYGEAQGAAKNHRTRVYQVCDGAGIVTNVAYDFKGNLRESKRELLPDYKQAVDWKPSPPANGGSFTSRTTYDALNRPVTLTTPDGSVYRPSFNEANLLDKVDVNLRGAGAVTPFVTNIDYNAKGQRERIRYGNEAATAYKYDPLTFRLVKLKTKRPGGRNGLAADIFVDPAVVQDLRYTYDPMGNITGIEDAALKTVHHNNKQVDPLSRYTYDALYRLVEAHGREHIGQTAQLDPQDGDYRDYPFVGHRHPNDLQALRTYTEHYEYDEVGNFEKLRHVVEGGNWTRSYSYDEDSLIEPGTKKSNRLSQTALGNGSSGSETYAYADDQGHDVHGCMTAINAMKMAWDFEDQLQRVELGGGGTAYYVYDAAGQRVRKVIEDHNGNRNKERIYLGGFEIYREYKADGSVELERESLHVMDDKQRIALVETKTIESGAGTASLPVQRYQLGNDLGSASMGLAEDGALITYEEYYPYGTTAFQARGGAEVSLKRYRYMGKERDEESGLYYYGARYYGCWIGRWTSCDPAGTRESSNLYEAFKSNPVYYYDPSGASAEVKEYLRRGGSCTELDLPVLQVPTNRPKGPTISTDRATPEERAEREAFAREYAEYEKTHGPTTVEWYLLERSMAEQRSRDPVRFVSQFATGRNLPGKATGYEGANRPRGGDSTYVRIYPPGSAGAGEFKPELPTLGSVPSSTAIRFLPSPSEILIPIATLPRARPEPKLLPPGGTPTKSLNEVRETKGTNPDRGAAGKEYVRELNSGSGEKAENTRMGKRQHDVSYDAARTKTEMRHEVKNYRMWVTENGAPRLNTVPLTRDLREQIDKDFVWVREGRRLGEHRIVQYDFVGAPPSPDNSSSVDILRRL